MGRRTLLHSVPQDFQRWPVSNFADGVDTVKAIRGDWTSQTDVSQRNAARESNDCAVIALSIAANITYLEARTFLRDEVGRKDGEGTPTGAMVFAYDSIYGRFNAKSKTARTVVAELASGSYMVSVRRHIFAVVDGVSFDCVETDLARVRRVWRVR